MIQRRVWVSGRVQGVGFRASTAQEGLKFPGLRGYVKNLADGRVEAVFCGEREAVEAMVEWSKRGPRSARVDEIVVQNEEVDSELPLFGVSI